MTASNAPEEPREIGRYRVTRLLLTYAEGVVYEAIDPLLERKLVIKVFSLDGVAAAEAAAVSDLFFDEIRRVGMLAHPGIATLFDAGVLPSGLYAATEHIEGMNLGAWLAERPDWPLANRVSVLAQVADVLEYVHGQGDAHLGLGATNVFVTADGAVRVAGFGAARVVQALRRARSDAPSVTPATTADSAERRIAQARADVYALGALARTVLAADADARVASVLERALSDDPAARFPSAGPFASALLDAVGLSPERDRLVWEPVRHGAAVGDNPTCAQETWSGALDSAELYDDSETRLSPGAPTVMARSRTDS